MLFERVHSILDPNNCILEFTNGDDYAMGYMGVSEEQKEREDQKTWLYLKNIKILDMQGAPKVQTPFVSDLFRCLIRVLKTFYSQRPTQAPPLGRGTCENFRKGLYRRRLVTISDYTSFYFLDSHSKRIL